MNTVITPRREMRRPMIPFRSHPRYRHWATSFFALAFEFPGAPWRWEQGNHVRWACPSEHRKDDQKHFVFRLPRGNAAVSFPVGRRALRAVRQQHPGQWVTCNRCIPSQTESPTATYQNCGTTNRRLVELPDRPTLLCSGCCHHPFACHVCM
ncbi:hypothetical protein N656DRAFT_470283 [Canariomyces notabilis]|uniref:Uncharacterized protein n=1 Tax=Canariomyces notabilis TaxID=2074819 RepID=A0AAN6QGB0_9PEZI|nr:hypothetical protein N656DRAFT_470283 [Canariomyces arenarius]